MVDSYASRKLKRHRPLKRCLLLHLRVFLAHGAGEYLQIEPTPPCAQRIVKKFPANSLQASSIGMLPQPPGSRGHDRTCISIGRKRNEPYGTAVTPTEAPHILHILVFGGTSHLGDSDSRSMTPILEAGISALLEEDSAHTQDTTVTLQMLVSLRGRALREQRRSATRCLLLMALILRELSHGSVLQSFAPVSPGNSADY